MNAAKLHRTAYKSKLIGLIGFLLLTFCLVQDSKCQTYNSALDSVVACCHYLKEDISYIRISFAFPDSAREFSVEESNDYVKARRIKKS